MKKIDKPQILKSSSSGPSSKVRPRSSRAHLTLISSNTLAQVNRNADNSEDGLFPSKEQDAAWQRILRDKLIGGWDATVSFTKKAAESSGWIFLSAAFTASTTLYFSAGMDSIHSEQKQTSEIVAELQDAIKHSGLLSPNNPTIVQGARVASRDNTDAVSILSGANGGGEGPPPDDPSRFRINPEAVGLIAEEAFEFAFEQVTSQMGKGSAPYGGDTHSESDISSGVAFDYGMLSFTPSAQFVNHMSRTYGYDRDFIHAVASETAKHLDLYLQDGNTPKQEQYEAVSEIVFVKGFEGAINSPLFNALNEGNPFLQAKALQEIIDIQDPHSLEGRTARAALEAFDIEVKQYPDYGFFDNSLPALYEGDDTNLLIESLKNRLNYLNEEIIEAQRMEPQNFLLLSTLGRNNNDQVRAFNSHPYYLGSTLTLEQASELTRLRANLGVTQQSLEALYAQVAFKERRKEEAAHLFTIASTLISSEEPQELVNAAYEVTNGNHMNSVLSEQDKRNLTYHLELTAESMNEELSLSPTY